jgi:hypothetical protein
MSWHTGRRAPSSIGTRGLSAGHSIFRANFAGAVRDIAERVSLLRVAEAGAVVLTGLVARQLVAGLFAAHPCARCCAGKGARFPPWAAQTNALRLSDLNGRSGLLSLLAGRQALSGADLDVHQLALFVIAKGARRSPGGGILDVVCGGRSPDGAMACVTAPLIEYYSAIVDLDRIAHGCCNCGGAKAFLRSH